MSDVRYHSQPSAYMKPVRANQKRAALLVIGNCWLFITDRAHLIAAGVMFTNASAFSLHPLGKCIIMQSS